MDNEQLIQLAQAVVHHRPVGDDSSTAGDVGCALVTANGNVYQGVCLDSSCGLGFCAERTAIAQMITQGENSVAKIVAVWNDENGVAYVLPPCGVCRQYMLSYCADALDINVVLSLDHTVKLADLMPMRWPDHMQRLP